MAIKDSDVARSAVKTDKTNYMKKRQLKKYLKREAKNGVLACNGKLFYSNERIIDNIFKKQVVTKRGLDDYPIAANYTFGMEMYKISEREHMAGIVMSQLSS